jgi:predicted nuclease of predicted toxin-antitoxin system
VAIEGLSLRLYADHIVDERFSVDLRRNGFDLILAREVGNQLLSDEEHLVWATAQNRVILTHDRKDFIPLAKAWALAGREHTGVILSAQPGEDIPYGALLRRLLRLLDSFTAEDMHDRVEWLDHRWDDNEA